MLLIVPVLDSISDATIGEDAEATGEPRESQCRSGDLESLSPRGHARIVTSRRKVLSAERLGRTLCRLRCRGIIGLTPVMGKHEKAAADESSEYPRYQICNIGEAFSSRTQIRAHLPLERVPEEDTAGDETENANSLEKAYLTHATIDSRDYDNTLDGKRGNLTY